MKRWNEESANSQKMNIQRHPKEISQELLDAICECNLIGIHGAVCSGKSSLAKEIIHRIGRGTHIEIDDFLSDDRGRPYLEQIKLNELDKLIIEAPSPIFLDCVIVLDVLQRLNKSADLILYCERTHSDTMFIGSPELNSLFESYRDRHHPEVTACHVFTLDISN